MRLGKLISTGNWFDGHRICLRPSQIRMGEKTLGKFFRNSSSYYDKLERGLISGPPLKILGELHRCVMQDARTIDANDPGMQRLGYADLHNMLKPALRKTIEIEKELTGNRNTPGKAFIQIADIIFVFSRLGFYYYVKKGNSDSEFTLLAAHSATLRYQMLGEKEKLAKVLSFIAKIKARHFPPSQKTTEDFLLDLFKELANKHINSLLSPDNANFFEKFYEFFEIGFNALSDNGNYPICHKLFSFVAEKFREAGRQKEAEEWLQKAEEMKRLSKLVLGM